MGKLLDAISDELANWIAQQPVFFVATAPSDPDGHVNVSPKGLDSFRVLGPHRVAYLDLTGSGIETVAHLRDNGRISIMFCAFAGRPKICRLHGRGAAHVVGSTRFEELAGEFPATPGTRSVIEVAVERVSTSCGFGVPLMEYVGARDDLPGWIAKKGEDDLVEYRATKNASSIDGLAGYRS